MPRAGSQSVCSSAYAMATTPTMRADRQVDVARHDDQDHAGGHDRHARRLNREGDHVGRLKERPVGQDVEADQDGDQGDQHPEQAQVDLGGAEQPAQRGAAHRLRLPEPVRCRRRQSWGSPDLEKMRAPCGAEVRDAQGATVSTRLARYSIADGRAGRPRSLPRRRLLGRSSLRRRQVCRVSAVTGVGFRMNDLTVFVARVRHTVRPGSRSRRVRLRPAGIDEAVRQRDVGDLGPSA